MSICDENGNPSHQFTQVAWTFLSEKEKDKSKRWNISLPVKCSTIQKINAWTNSFVHAGRFNMIWQQYYALEIVGALMKPSTNYIRECNGNCRQSMMFGDFKIEGYYWMKKDFEEYVYKGAQRIKSPRVIWNDIEKIGAYMLSYGSPSILFLVDTFNASRGLSKTGEYLINSVYLNRFVNKNIIDHNFGSEDNFVSKLRKGFLYLTKVVKSIKVNNAVAAYINPRTSGFGLLADFLVIQITSVHEILLT